MNDTLFLDQQVIILSSDRDSLSDRQPDSSARNPFRKDYCEQFVRMKGNTKSVVLSGLLR